MWSGLSAISPDADNTHEKASTRNHSAHQLHLPLPRHLGLDLLSIDGVLVHIFAATGATAGLPADRDIVAVAHRFPSSDLAVFCSGGLHSLAGAEPREALEAVEPPLDALAADEGCQGGPQEVGVFVALAGEREGGDEAEARDGGEG